MKKSSVLGIVVGGIGAILTIVGGAVKHAYTTGSSYFVTHAEEQAIILKAQTALYIGIALMLVGIILVVVKRQKNN